MVGLNPADIVTQLRFLFIVVCCLFGFMNSGAAVAFVMDMQHRRYTVGRIKTPDMGFLELPDGTWLWSFTQDELDRAVAAPSGSAVNFIALFGFPFIRLRCALPEELLRGSIGQALGRRLGLSAGGLSDSKEEHHHTFAQLRRNSSSLLSSQGPSTPRSSFYGLLMPARSSLVTLVPVTATNLSLVSVDLPTCGEGGSPEYSSETPRPRMSTARASFTRLSSARFSLTDMSAETSELTGSALAFAYLASQRAMPYDELNARLAATARHFKGCRVPGIAHDFMQLHKLFSLMVGFDSGSIAATKQWLTTARLWRLILLQQEDGGWNLTGSLAFVVESHPGKAPKKGKKTETAVLAKLCGCLFMDDEEDLDAMLEDVDDMVDDVVRIGTKKTDVEESANDRDVPVDDCPLTFSRSEMLRRIPKLLARTDGGERLWATSLAVEVLRNMDVSWLASDEEGAEETIVDKGIAYIKACCEQQPELAEFVASGALKKYTKRTLRQWRAVTDAATQRTRDHEVTGAYAMLTYAQRAGAHIVKSVRVDHSTFSVFLDADSFLLRWQSWMLLLTLVASSLLTSIWFYSSRATQCCSEIRTLLDAGAGGSCLSPSSTSVVIGSSAAYLLDGGLSSTCDPATPMGVCLGYLGECADLADQFSTLQGAYFYGPPGDVQCHDTLSDYECHAFPDDAYPSDQLLVGLICVAVSLPVTLVLEHLFELSNLTDEMEGWLEWKGVLKILLGIASHHKWQWASKKRPSDLIVWLCSIYPEAAPWEFFAFASWWIPKQLLPGAAYRCLASALGAEEKAEEAERGCGKDPGAAHGELHRDEATPHASPTLGDKAGGAALLTVRVPRASSAASLASAGSTPRSSHAPSPPSPDSGDREGALLTGQVPGSESAASMAAAENDPSPRSSAAASPRETTHGFNGDIESNAAVFGGHVRAPLPATPMDEEGSDAQPLEMQMPRASSAVSLVPTLSPSSSSANLFLTESPTTVLPNNNNTPRIAAILSVKAAFGLNDSTPHKRTAYKVDPRGEDETETEDGDEDGEEEALTSRQARLYAAIGFVGVYVTWAIFSWFIFTYGMIIYRQLGKKTEQQFSKTFGIGYALDQLAQWQDVFTTAFKAAFLVVFLDMLRITRNMSWLETYVDFLSVQAHLFDGQARGAVRQTVKLASRIYRTFD